MAYCKKRSAMNVWIKDWMKNDFKKVENRDLFLILQALTEARKKRGNVLFVCTKILNLLFITCSRG